MYVVCELLATGCIPTPIHFTNPVVLFCPCIVYRKMQHPNILCLLGTVESEGAVMVITNYVNGNNLSTLLFDTSHDRVSISNSHPPEEWRSMLLLVYRIHMHCLQVQ